MTEKYYVVSESELDKLTKESYTIGELEGQGYTMYNDDDLRKAEAACRARPVHVKSIFSNGAGEQAITWEEIKR